jgi:hypothetical protein
MSGKIKLILKLLLGIAVILGAAWYLVNQFSFIGAKLDQVVLMDLPKIKNALEESTEENKKIETGMDVLTQGISSLGDQAESVSKIESNVKLLVRKINDELISEITQFGEVSEKNIEAVSKKIDTLSRQYVKFMKLAEDKIVVSIPPKWVDELPHRTGTIFALGIGTATNKLNRAQQYAAEQARSTIAMMLEKKTFSAVKYTIQSVGKPPPRSLEDLSGELKKQIAEAVKEILADSRVESYWVDPTGYVYALVALPIEKSIEGSKLGVLIETLRLTHQSITEALVQDFKKQLKLELLK